MAVFLDIERAYDTVWRDGLITKLQKLGIRGLMLQWIQDHISERSFQVRVGSNTTMSFLWRMEYLRVV